MFCLYSLEATQIKDGLEVGIGGARIAFKDGVASLSFTDDSGSGRTIRKAKIGSCDDVTVIADRSSREIFWNGGRTVMSSRFYPDTTAPAIVYAGCELSVRKLKKTEVRGFE